MFVSSAGCLCDLGTSLCTYGRSVILRPLCTSRRQASRPRPPVDWCSPLVSSRSELVSKLGEYSCPGCMTLICHRETSSQSAITVREKGLGVWGGWILGIRDSIGRRRNGASWRLLAPHPVHTRVWPQMSMELLTIRRGTYSLMVFWSHVSLVLPSHTFSLAHVRICTAEIILFAEKDFKRRMSTKKDNQTKKQINP